MDSKTLEEIQDWFEEDVEQQKLFNAYNDMDTMTWALPSSLATKDWVRQRISTDAHDALKTMTNIFDTYNPKWDVLPFGEADVDRAEMLEVWLEYHMQKANNAGETSPFRKGLHNSGKYNRVIYEVGYLPYYLPKDKSKWTKEQKANVSRGPFCITAHDPRCFYYQMGKYGLRGIANISVMDGQQIIDHWSIYESDTEEGKQIKAGLAKILAKMGEPDGKDNDTTDDFIYVDFTTHDKRIVTAFPTPHENINDFCNVTADAGIDILNGDNKLGFIPYAVATGDSDPLLHSMHVGGIWENQNFIETIVDSTVLRRAIFPLLQHTSLTGKELEMNYDGTQDIVELQQGETVQTLVPPPIDAGLQQLANINGSRMGKSVGIQNLGMMDIAGNVQYSTVQAQIQLMLTNLAPYKRTAEKALVDAALILFKWAEFVGEGVVAYRKTPKSQEKYKGEQIVVTGDDFDPDEMIISCELLSNSPTDKQQLVNMFTTLKQAGAQVAWGELLERLQLGNPEVLKAEWMTEQLEGAALQNFVSEMQAKLQLKVEAEKLKMQEQLRAAQLASQNAQAGATPPDTASQNPAPQDQINPQGGGYDPAMGGQPPMMAEPGMTRNQVSNPG